MISLVPGTKVYLACQPINLRAGFDGLAAYLVNDGEKDHWLPNTTVAVIQMVDNR